MKVFRRSPPPSPDARARALARLAVRPTTPADPARDNLHPHDPEDLEEREEVRGGWIPDQLRPDQLRNTRWTLGPRHILILLALLALGLTWATWSFLQSRPTPIPNAHPTTATSGSPVSQPSPQPQPCPTESQPPPQPAQSPPRLEATHPCTTTSQPGAGQTQPSAGQTQPGAGQIEPGAGQTGPGAGQTQPGAGPPPGTSPGQPLVIVHVAGKVRRPGLIRAPAGSRVADVLALAGGPLRGVDLTTLNLARQVTDGEQILVGHDTQPPPPPGPPSTPGQPTPTTAPNTPVNLNTATLEQLDALPGVGPVLAQRILDYRTQNGPFTTVDQLQEVPGVGPKKFNSLKPHVRT